MKVVTYNMRCDVPADGVNRFTRRRGLVIDKIETEMPDLIGFQEITPPMNEYLKAHLHGYMMVGCGRGKTYQDEHNPIAFRSDKYELIALDVTWLSPTPYVPGSRFEVQSSCPRIITHTVLRPIGDGEPFHFYNTHLDHQYAEARIAGAKRLIEKIEEDQKIYPFPLVITGDFNANPDAEEIGMFKASETGISDVTENMGITFHDWGRRDEGQIDYIFIRGFNAETEAVKWTDEWNGVYLTDHYPIEITLSRKDGGIL